MELRRNSWQVQPPWIPTAQMALHKPPDPKNGVEEERLAGTVTWIPMAQMALHNPPDPKDGVEEEQLAGTAALDPHSPDGPP